MGVGSGVTVQLTGGHDVDQGWIADVRRAAGGEAGVQVVPRFQLQSWTVADYQRLFTYQDFSVKVITTLVDECVYVHKTTY